MPRAIPVFQYEIFQVQEFLDNCLSIPLAFLFALKLEVGHLLSAPAVDRTRKMLFFAVLASCEVTDVHELQHVHVALLLELFGCFSIHSTHRFPFTDLSRLSVIDFSFW